MKRLAALLFADVVDYSRLMSADEAATIAALTAFRREIFEPMVADANGDILKRMGDGWIAEVPNVADAVAGAIRV